MTDAQDRDLWDEYKQAPSMATRDSLIDRYSSLVDIAASQASSGLPRSVEHAELVSFGFFGLVDAIDKFEPERAVKFETYAMQRIRGAILDELRSADWVPRSVRAKAKAVLGASSRLEAKLLRNPSEPEMAAELGVSEVEMQDLFTVVSRLQVVSLDEPFGTESNEDGLGNKLKSVGDSPASSYEIDEMKQSLANVVSRLEDRERLVFLLYYTQDLTLAEIGVILGVTESRVCQIHTKAVVQVRDMMMA